MSDWTPIVEQLTLVTCLVTRELVPAHDARTLNGMHGGLTLADPDPTT